MRRNSNLAWESLEKAEYEQELTLWEEPTRQEKLKRLVPLSFYGKDSIKETWSRKNQNLTSEHNAGFNSVAVEAASSS